MPKNILPIAIDKRCKHKATANDMAIVFFTFKCLLKLTHLQYLIFYIFLKYRINRMQQNTSFLLISNQSLIKISLVYTLSFTSSRQLS